MPHRDLKESLNILLITPISSSLRIFTSKERSPSEIFTAAALMPLTGVRINFFSLNHSRPKKRTDTTITAPSIKAITFIASFWTENDTFIAPRIGFSPPWHFWHDGEFLRRRERMILPLSFLTMVSLPLLSSDLNSEINPDSRAEDSGLNASLPS